VDNPNSCLAGRFSRLLCAEAAGRAYYKIVCAELFRTGIGMRAVGSKGELIEKYYFFLDNVRRRSVTLPTI